MARYLMGIDVGTNGCKVTIIGEDGGVKSTVSMEYPVLFPKPGWAEQDPESVFRTSVAAISEAMRRGGVEGEDIAGIGFSGHMHSLVSIDREGKPVRPIIVWMDQRSLRQVEKIKSVLGEDRVMEITYNPVTTTYTLPMLMWIKEEEPERWKSIHKVMQPKDYVRFRLTGEVATDYTDAASTLMFDNRRYEWSDEILDAVKIPKDILAQVYPPHEIVGYVTREAAEETGLKEGTPVVAGSGDVAAESFAVGLLSEGNSLIRLGTAGAIFVVTRSPVRDPKKRVFYFAHVIKGLWFIVAATQAAGWSIRWLKDTMYEGVEEAYKLIDKEAEEVPPGSEGLIYHPYLMGERSPYWDPYLRGDFIGVTARHSRKHFARAVLEGVAFSFRDNFEVIRELGVEPESVKLIGGGARSDVWRRIICNVLGVKAYVPEVGDASLGAAMLAGLGIGVFRGYEEAVERCLRISAVEEPDAKVHEVYTAMFKMYKEAQRRLQSLYHELNKVIEGIKD